MKRFLSLVLVVFLVLFMVICTAMASVYNEMDYLTVSFIDVRMGDCILLSCGGENMLIDGGMKKSATIIKKYFDQIGLEKLDYMFNTHFHEDHIGGLSKLLKENFPVDVYLSPYPDDFKWDKTQIEVQNLLKKKEVEYVQVAGGEEMYLGEAHLEFFRDMSKDVGTNGHSVVTMVTFGQVKILLMADVGGLAQWHLLAKYGAEVFKADILKYSHHGYMPMVKEFMDVIDPDLAVVTNNKKAVPGCESQLKKRDIDRFYTQSGTVVIETDGEDWSVCQMP